jgi:hypothetical protein
VNTDQKLYYQLMLGMNRALLITRDDHLVAVVTYLIGDDDDRYLHDRVPWTLIEDEPWGTTAYIDQLIVKEHDSYSYIHKEFRNVIKHIKQQFPQVKRVKWIRIGAMFRKHRQKEGVKSYVHCKDIE